MEILEADMKIYEYFPYSPENCPSHRWWRIAGEKFKSCSLCGIKVEDKE